MHKRISIILSAAIAISSLCAAVSAKDSGSTDGLLDLSGEVTHIYVSADGDDGAAGTEASPFRSITRARDKVREINGDMKGDIVVHIKEGTYTLDETFTLSAEDSGNGGYRVIYAGEGKDATLISGGFSPEGWELHDEENNVYSVQLPEGIDTRQLYVNGERAMRARSGKVGEYSTRILGAERIKDGTVLPELLSVDNADSRAQADDGTLFISKGDGTLDGSWGNLNDIELHVFTAWCVNVLRIKSITETDEQYNVKIMDEEAELVFNRQHPNIDGYSHMNTHNFIYYVENAYELMDEDNEWYLDRSTGILYYKAPAGTDMSSAETTVPRIETLVSVSGTLDAPVKNIAFTGIGFEYSGWTGPSEKGLVDGQAMQYVTRTAFAANDVGVGRTPAGITVEAAEGIIFDNVGISKMGATGIDLHFGTKNCIIANSLISDISGNGVAVGKFAEDDNVDYHEPYNPADKREVCSGDVIVNNEIFRIGRDYESAVAVAAGYPEGILIANNTVAYAPYTGISVGFGWTRSANAMNGNRILRNEIHHVTEVLCDAGGIYTLSEQPDSEMWGNYIHDISLPSWADYGTNGIYLDEGTGGYLITANVVEKAYGVNSHATGTNKISGNYVNESGIVTEEAAKKIKELAGVQPVINLADYESIPEIGGDLPEFEYTEILSDDFESYEDGRISSDLWTVQKAQRDLATVATVSGNKVIKLTSKGSNTKLYAELSGGANVTEFDFCFEDALSGYEGMYNVIRDSGTVYTANLTPAYGTTVRLETKGTDEAGISKVIKSGKWYTCKTMVYEKMMYIKVWAQSEDEPAGWDVIKDMKDAVNGDGVLGLEFYASGEKSMYVDNISVMGISIKAQEEEPPTVDTEDITTDTDPTDTETDKSDGSESESESETEAKPEEKGCGASLSSAALPASLLCALAAGITARKKRSDSEE